MTPELWKRLQPLYDAAIDMPTEERAQFVREACRDDDELRHELETLLAANDEGTDTLDAPLVDFSNLGRANEDILCEGTLLLGRFEIVRRVGSGGMGDVYEAIDLELGRIALKTVRPAIAQNPAILARFREEVLLARPISGPNVCHIYELYVPPKGSGCPYAAFLTMEFLDGVTLADRIASSGSIAPSEALRIAAQLCAALRSIHEAGVVHRDLKPRNVMLVPRNGSEQVVVMDFGLARALSTKSSTDTTGLTTPGVIMGTLAYMAPEQFEGGEVSPATDIYALGILLYELVTGQQPFAAPTPFGAAVRRGRRPPSPSSVCKGVPPIWDDVICKCIEFDPECRYQSVNEVIAALNQHQLTILRLPRGLRLSLNRAGLIAAAAVILAGLTAAGWLWYQAARLQTLSPQGKYWYDRGMMALRDGTYLQAINEFKEVVIRDNKFALTHARLADAWAELDFTGEAQSEMLQAAAPEAQNTMPELSREYVDAVRRTLIRDYSAAAQDYEEILKHLPEDQKADGYVDLGRAYEKAGRIKETIACYEQAAKMRPDDPAPFVHLGILRSRQRDPAGAEAAFSKAEALYGATSNQEGLAEVAYQRGYAANEADDSQHALRYLNDSRDIAERIKSPQLKARSLAQLSSVLYNSNRDDEAIEDANLAIQLARDNGLEYWSTDGTVRLANAYLEKNDFAKAESNAQKALQLSRQNQHPRIEASSEFTLASIRDQQGGKWQEEIGYAQAALKYYTDFGFLNSAAAASILVVRGELGKGDFAAARKDSFELLQLANKTGSEATLTYAEDIAGSVSFALEDYPDALNHYERALKVSRSLHQSEADQEISCAATLWRLGRYKDAESDLKEIPDAVRARADTTLSIDDAEAPMRLSQGRYREAFEISNRALNHVPDISVGQVADFKQAMALSEGRLGQPRMAELHADQLLTLGRQNSDEGMAAQAELVSGELLFRENQPEKALPVLRAASQYFSKMGMKDSEWRTFLLLAKAARASGDKITCSEYATKARDTLKDVEQSWGSAIFLQYCSRPDYRTEVQELSKIH